VTLIDLSVSLVGVLIALPAALTLASSLTARRTLALRGKEPLAGPRERGLAGKGSARG
jgi:hypothetical protein